MAPIRVLFLAASPDDRVRLRLDEEARAIDQRIRSSDYRDAIEVVSKWAVRPTELQEALMRHKPHIVHFSGHGEAVGIELQGDDGMARLVPAATLASMFATLAGEIRVVVFNACYSEPQARAVAQHIDVAIGMREAIGKSAAFAFASAFYMGLAYGQSVRSAFEVGVNEIRLAGSSDDDKPVLLQRDGVDAGTIVMAGPSATNSKPATAPSASSSARSASSSAASTTGSGSAASSGPSVSPPAAPTAPPAAPSTLPEHLIDDLEPLRDKLHGSKNAVVPFVGSGLSMPALPSWYAFLKSLIGRASPANQARWNDLLDKGRYLDVASLLEREPTIGKPIISQAIQRNFGRPKSPRPEVYDLVASLPAEHFLTTNYDPWLKQAVSRHVGLPRVYIPADASSMADLDAGSPPLVLMLHGDADRPEHCVLSARAYRKLQHGKPTFKHAMRALAGQRTFLFMGYSLSDPDIAVVLDEWAEIFTPDGGVPRHFILGAGFSDIDRMTLLDRAVLPIDYSPGDRRDHSLLPQILRWLATTP